jgi:VWFA-related protein
MPLLFTGDVKKARDLVSRIGAFGSAGRVEELEDRYQRDLKEDGYADARPEDKLSWNQLKAKVFNPWAEMRHFLRMYLDSLLALARALRYEPGQKNLVFFSYGAPYRSIWRGDQINLGKENLMPDQFSELRRKADALLDELASSNVTVFALNTAELSPVSELVRGGTLQKMAQTTGGRYWGNVYEAAPFVDLVQSQTGSYYVLGFPVSERWDGRFHKIKVDVRKPGLTVRTQAGYFSPKAFADFNEDERRMQLVDLALAVSPLSRTPLRFPMAVVPVGRPGAAGLRLAASIPLDEVREAVGTRAEITALAFNAADEIAAESRMEADLASLSGATAAVLADLAVGPGEYQCRIVLRSLETGRAAVAGAAATVPGAIEPGFRILPPLCLRPERTAAVWKPVPLAGTPSAPAVGRPLFDPSQYAPHAEGVLHIGTEIALEVQVIGAGGAEARIRVGAFLFDHLNQVGIPVPTTVLARRDEGNVATFLIRLSIPDVEPDVYALVLTAEDEKSGEKVDFQSDFAVEKALMNRQAAGQPR